MRDLMPCSLSLLTRLHRFLKVRLDYSRPNSGRRCGSIQPVCRNCARCWKEDWHELGSARQKRRTNLLLPPDQQVLMLVSQSSCGLYLGIQLAAKSKKLCRVSASKLARQIAPTPS